MKTSTLLKTASIILLLFAFSSTLMQLNAQESEEKKKEVRIKMIKEVDGKETVIDTTFEISSLEDFEELDDLDVIIGDELIENLGIKLNDLDENDEVDVQVMTIESNSEGEEHMMVISTEIEEEMGDDGETIKTIDLIIEVADSLDNAKVIKLQMDGDEQTVFISDDNEMKTIQGADGEKTIIITQKGDFSDEDIIVVQGDSISWNDKMGTNVVVEETDEGDKVIVTDADGVVTEYIIKDGKGAYMIDEDGNVTKAEDDKDVIWTEEGNNVWVDVESDDDSDVIIVKSINGEANSEDLDETYNVFVTEGGDGEEKEVYVNVIEKKEGDKTIVIKTKIIIESPDDDDKETMEKVGVNLFPESEENELKVENLKFSPNPNNGKFTLKFKTLESGITDIRIYDIKGVEVYKESLKDFNGAYEKEIDISGEKSGTYFLKVAQGENIMSRKIVVE